ncbi:hypothetical protein [Elizabethkingia sp. JS20170427COW]|uniref:hypothetical protein n=1 Tax=Elizabethkingia sp. JS20170427COW TaxID=2583851 RepID=UPI0011105F62|nr:hypothetical protein [Elizabethkingia sp. JS20170427COW]QCX53256.1 hypothetical protein FGE20_05685 [Elizabethkingia sp. JS20170427COW]
MNIAQQIIQSLQKSGKVELSGLGVLKLKRNHAQVDDVTETILPPKQEIIFEPNRSLEVENDFSSLARTCLAEMVMKGEYTVEGLGKWINDAGKIVFEAEENLFAHHFFGLEAISFPKISPVEEVKQEVEEKLVEEQLPQSSGKSIAWMFLIILPVLGLVYLAFTQRELLFGKKSFEKVTVKTSTHRIQNVAPKEVKVLPSDSIKKDSLINKTPQEK